MSFDRVATIYPALEKLTAGNLVQQARTAHLSSLSDTDRILILGEGTGRFLEALMNHNPAARIDVVDASRAMLKTAEQRVTDRSTATSTNAPRFIHHDALTWQPDAGAYDAVVTNFFLDCFSPEELRQLVPHVASMTRHGSVWLNADFSIPPRGWRRFRARMIHWLMYRFFRLTTGLSARRLTSPDPLMKEAGFGLRERIAGNHGLLQSDVWEKK